MSVYVTYKGWLTCVRRQSIFRSRKWKNHPSWVVLGNGCLWVFKNQMEDQFHKRIDLKDYASLVIGDAEEYSVGTLYTIRVIHKINDKKNIQFSTTNKDDQRNWSKKINDQITSYRWMRDHDDKAEDYEKVTAEDIVQIEEFKIKSKSKKSKKVSMSSLPAEVVDQYHDREPRTQTQRKPPPNLKPRPPLIPTKSKSMVSELAQKQKKTVNFQSNYNNPSTSFAESASPPIPPRPRTTTKARRAPPPIPGEQVEVIHHHHQTVTAKTTTITSVNNNNYPKPGRLYRGRSCPDLNRDYDDGSDSDDYPEDDWNEFLTYRRRDSCDYEDFEEYEQCYK